MQTPTSSHKVKLSLFVWKYFTWLNIAFFLTLLFLGYTYIIRPKYQAIGRENSRALENLKNEYEKRDRYLSHLIRLRKQFLKISEADRQKVNKILASQIDMENLLKQIELIVKKNGFLIESLSVKAVTAADQEAAAPAQAKKPKPKKKQEDIGKIEIQLSLGGVNYQSLKRLLGIFEQNIRLMDVNEIDFKPSSESVDLKIYTYYETGANNSRPTIKQN